MSAADALPAFLGRDILSIGDLSRDEMLFVLDATRALTRGATTTASGKPFPSLAEIRARLAGRCLYYAFFEPSTRTRFSFVQAARMLGLSTLGFSNTAGTSVVKGEPLKDTLRMVQGYGADAIVMRHPLAGSALWGAENVDVPILNAGDGAHEHPTQTLLDLYTMLDAVHGARGFAGLSDLGGLTVSFVGDLKYGRTVHSLVTALARFSGVRVRLVAPPSLQLPAQYFDLLTDTGVPHTRHTRLEEVVGESDILYMTRIQKERIPDPTELERVRRAYHLMAGHLEGAKPSLRVMHPLPRDKQNLELDFSVDTTPHAAYYEQAENGLRVRMALLALVLGGIETPRHERRAPDVAAHRARFEAVHGAAARATKPNPQYLFAIEDGTVIDHIHPGRSGAVKASLRLPQVPVLVAENLDSRRMPGGRKDLLKIIGYRPGQAELDQIALISPDATISLIREGKVYEKGKVVLPELVRDWLLCVNPNCISRPEYQEGVPTLFRTLSRRPLLLRCCYCDAHLRREDFAFLEGAAP
jgi:aspartate carbamoyltransferase catalytic subunit